MQETPMTQRQWQLYRQAWHLAYLCYAAIPEGYSKIRRELKLQLDAMPEPVVVPYTPDPAPDNAPTGAGYKLVSLLDDDTTQVIID